MGHGLASHYNDVIMTTIASQITSLAVVYSTVYSDADQRKHQSSTSLAFVWGIHRDRWIPRTKGQLRGKCFHLMTSSCAMYGSWPRDIMVIWLYGAPESTSLMVIWSGWIKSGNQLELAGLDELSLRDCLDISVYDIVAVTVMAFQKLKSKFVFVWGKCSQIVECL